MIDEAREARNDGLVVRCQPGTGGQEADPLPPLVGWPQVLELSPGDALDLSVRRAEGGELLASATLVLPSSVAVARATGLDPVHLETTAFLGRVAVRDGPERDTWVAWIAYAALREARMRGFTTYAAWVAGDPSDRPPSFAGAIGTALALRPVPGFEASSDGLVLGARDIAYGLTRFADAAAAGGHPVLPSFLVDEVARTLEAYFAKIVDTAWFRAVYEERLSREAYVYALGNLHQFVRYTTRLIGRCVASSSDSFLRAHFARHLREEINHELIIEQDLRYLGEDVDYVVKRMVPNPSTRRFMSTQESAIGFHQDPILTMAAALSAEGIAAQLDSRFMESLHATVAGWGVADPPKATRFLSSHIEFDGGDDGHFAGTMKVLESYIQDESRLQQFLSFLGAAMAAMMGSYESWQSDFRLFSARVPGTR